MKAARSVEKVLLINPFFQWRTRSIAQQSVGPPLGLAYLAAVLEQHGYDCTLLDANALQLSPDETIARVAAARPDVVGTTMVTPTLDLAGGLIRRVRAALPDAVTVMGGIHPTTLPAETLEAVPEADYLVRGEGEVTFPRLLDALHRHETLDLIPGLAFRSPRGEAVITPTAEPVADLDGLPLPARDLLPMDRYRAPDSGRLNCVVSMRGCPCGCTYCGVPVLFGRKMRVRKPALVAEEIAHCYERYGSRYLSFLDDTFTHNRKWVLALCREMIDRGLPRKVHWICLTRANMVDVELLETMKEAGCIRVEMGIESGSPAMLELLEKGVSVDEMVK